MWKTSERGLQAQGTEVSVDAAYTTPYELHQHEYGNHELHQHLY